MRLPFEPLKGERSLRFIEYTLTDVKPNDANNVPIRALPRWLWYFRDSMFNRR
jgi:hypothetical protein